MKRHLFLIFKMWAIFFASSLHAQTYDESPCAGYLAMLDLKSGFADNVNNCSNRELMAIARASGKTNSLGLIHMIELLKVGGYEDAHSLLEISRRLFAKPDDDIVSAGLFFMSATQTIQLAMYWNGDEERKEAYGYLFGTWFLRYQISIANGDFIERFTKAEKLFLTGYDFKEVQCAYDYDSFSVPYSQLVNSAVVRSCIRKTP